MIFSENRYTLFRIMLWRPPNPKENDNDDQCSVHASDPR